MRYARCRCSRAHPRSRGENGKWSGDTKAWLGSSPLTRGKRSRCRSQEIVPGLIPAYAGKTSRSAGSFWWPGAHPRLRGENRRPLVRPERRLGSSPLTRGKQAASRGCCVAARLIHADTRKTKPQQPCSSTPPAHPRFRRENMGPASSGLMKPGSSPLTRGKLPGVDIPERRLRLIPAHAGKTTGGEWSHGRVRAHPHSHGENAPACEPAFSSQGSSPLTRGKHLAVQYAGDTLGLIPTHAGKTVTTRRRTSPTRAHPRSRGENPFCAVMRISWLGSSPLTQGKPGDRSADRLPGGLIPTHAGKTSPTAT